MDVTVSRAVSPSPPSSPMATSLIRASASVDALTQALAGLSRPSTPEPGSRTVLACCGGHRPDECPWAEVKAKLERRLTLSARACLAWPRGRLRR
jgi:hypothetical protein